MSAYEPAGYCPRCGYQLGAGRCPECGRLVPRPLNVPPRVLRKRMIVRAIVATAFSALAFAAYYWRVELAEHLVPMRVVEQLANGDGSFEPYWREVLNRQHRRALAAEVARYEALAAAIDDEIARLGKHDWAGHYESRFADLRLAPSGSYSLWSWGLCGGIVECGTVKSVSPDELCLQSAASSGYSDARTWRFFRVPWQGRNYLIEDDELPGFANHVNARDAETPLWYLRRFGDPSASEPRLPQLPAPYAAYILRKPVVADVLQILRVERDDPLANWHCWQAYFVLNVGAREGVFVGMRFHPLHRPHDFGAEVLEVRDHESTVRLSESVECEESIDIPHLGWRFTTLHPFPDADSGATQSNIDAAASGINPLEAEPNLDPAARLPNP